MDLMKYTDGIHFTIGTLLISLDKYVLDLLKFCLAWSVLQQTLPTISIVLINLPTICNNIFLHNLGRGVRNWGGGHTPVMPLATGDTSMFFFREEKRRKRESTNYYG